MSVYLQFLWEAFDTSDLILEPFDYAKYIKIGVVLMQRLLSLVASLSYVFFHWKGALTESSIQMKIFVNPRFAVEGV